MRLFLGALEFKSPLCYTVRQKTREEQLLTPKKEIIMIHTYHKYGISTGQPERVDIVIHRIDISGKTFFFLFLMFLFVKYVLLELGTLLLK